MDDKTLFLQFWDKEAAATRKVISRIPEGFDLSARSEIPNRARDRLADRARRKRPRRRAGEGDARVAGGCCAGDR